MLRKLILAAVVWGMLGVVPVEARTAAPDTGTPNPNRLEGNGKMGKSVEARRGKKKGKRAGKRKKGQKTVVGKKKNKKRRK